MQGSKLNYQAWAIAMYMMVTNLKSVSSMKLHRKLEITQKSAWHLAHRLWEGLISGSNQFSDPVEADETYIILAANTRICPMPRERSLKKPSRVGDP